MRGRSSLVRILLLLTVLGLSTTCGSSGGGGGVPDTRCCQSDGPICPSFDDTGAWDPVPAQIQDVALETLGARTSLRYDGGKPYYQMRLGMNSADAAQRLACAFDVVPELTVDPYFFREAWCSEALSYWHREAQIPYATGFRNSTWHFGWQMVNTGSLRTYYQAEQATGGRGRWLPWSDIDYVNYELGVTVPAPGAWVFIKHLNAAGEWDGGAHTMMVDEMRVWMNGESASKIELTILEGNTFGAIVANTRVIADVRDSTPFGTTNLTGGKRIVGFGVDLDASGDVIYDASRLTVYPSVQQPPATLNPWLIKDDVWDAVFAPRLPVIISYIDTVGPGPDVASNTQMIPAAGIPDGAGTRWSFPADADTVAPQGFQVDVDLRAEYPLPVRSVLLQWSGEKLPRGYQVYWAGTNAEFQMATVPDLTEDEVPLDARGRAVAPITVVLNSQGVAVRWLRFVFPPGSLGGAATLEELTLTTDWGADDDADP